jgi:outer membrane protein assembly factor BamB
MNVLMRSYTSARTGANTEETVLTPARVGSNLLVKRFSLKLPDDPRLEAQPLLVSGVTIGAGAPRDVVYVCTMANNVFAFDAANGNKVWPNPVNLGRPIVPAANANGGTEIELFHINVHWGILSTPVIDLDTKTMFIVCWTSPNGSVAKAQFQVHALDITTGNQVHPPLTIAATAEAQAAANVVFRPSRHKQRASLVLTLTRDATGTQHKTLFVAFSITHEEGDPQAHGWIMAFDVQAFRQTAAWCTTPHGGGCGIWQAGSGIAADDAGDLYVMTGNYGVGGAPAAGDLPESFVKLHYTPPAAPGAQGRLEPVAWFTPFHDADRNPAGDDDFQDYDLGSAGPSLIPDFGFVVGAGKDGVLFVLDQDTNRFGQGSDFAVLKKPPLFYTYFPGFGIDPTHVQNLDHLYTGKTHHLHTGSVYWHNPTLGPMLFCWGENECLRAWKIDGSGQATFFAKSAEIASAGMGGRGGMPGGILSLSANGNQPNTGIIWALAPISGDANKHIVAGILRAYDATNLDPVPNADGTPRLKLLWDSTHIPGNTFNFCKFCPPVIANGQVYAPTYDGHIDVYGLIGVAPGPIATNARPTHLIKRMQKEP